MIKSYSGNLQTQHIFVWTYPLISKNALRAYKGALTLLKYIIVSEIDPKLVQISITLGIGIISHKGTMDPV